MVYPSVFSRLTHATSQQQNTPNIFIYIKCQNSTYFDYIIKKGDEKNIKNINKKKENISRINIQQIIISIIIIISIVYYNSSEEKFSYLYIMRNGKRFQFQ